MNKVLINFAHPMKRRSKVNMALRKAIENIEGVTVNDLYSNYPDFLIDVQREQKLCEEHNVIIFQHPFYWYSTPAIINEWLDLVLEYNWAYGSKGKALKDKLFLQALSAGGDQETYQREGLNKFTIRELTSNIQATTALCEMIWLPPFCVFGTHKIPSEEKISFYAEQYRQVIIALKFGNLDIDLVKQEQYLNRNLDMVLRKQD